MSSIIKVDTIQSAAGSTILGQTNSTTITLGVTGQTITVPSGVTMVNNGTQTGFGGENTPAFFAYKGSGTNQTISNNTYTKVEFNTESFDTDSNYASNRFTPTTAGKYFIFANIACDASAGQFDSALLAIRKNGSLLYEVTNQQSTNNANHINIPINIVDDANGSSDYYEVWVSITDSSGSPVINAGAGNRRCTFGAYKIIGA